jgi:hypothetical protein
MATPKKKVEVVAERTEICRECRFADIKRGDGLRCFRFPPVFVYDYQTGTSSAQNPEVNPDHWCGEFKAPLNS